MSDRLNSTLCASILLETFRFLRLEDLISCSKVCKSLHNSIYSSSNEILWHQAYNDLLFIKTRYNDRFNWIEKVSDVSRLISGSPLTINNISRKIVSRSGHSATLFENKYLFLFGGMSHFNTFLSGYTLIDIERGEVLADQKLIHGDIIKPRWLHTVSLVNFEEREIAILFGGQSNAFNDSIFGNFYLIEFDNTPSNYFKAKEVSLLGSKISARYGHSAAVFSNTYIIILGGLGSSKFYNDMYILSINNSNEIMSTLIDAIGSCPTPRYCHSTVVYGENMYIFGGWDHRTFYNDLHVYNRISNSWSEIKTTGSVPRARCQCSMVLFVRKKEDILLFGESWRKEKNKSSYIFLFGGANGNQMVSMIIYLTTLINTHSKI